MPSDSSNKLEVHLREATLADVPAAARVLTSAFVDDPLSALLFPKRREFPDGYDQRYRAIARAGILSPESVCLIAEADVQDDQGNWQRDVAGFAYWIRKIGKKDMEGKDAEKIQRWKQGRDSWMKWTERNIVNCTEYLESKLYSTPVADPKLLAEFPKFFESIEKKYYTYPDDSAWYLKIIAINPKHQRKGVGRKMVQWGVSKSEEEGVPALLEASPAGEGLYLSMGYEDVGGETLTAESGEHASLRVMKRYPKNKSSVR